MPTSFTNRLATSEMGGGLLSNFRCTIDVIADARTEPNPEIFHPDDGRSFYARVGEPFRSRVQEIQIVFVFVNSRMPVAPSSRPKPERFTPPNGKRGSEATIALMKT